MDFCDGGDLTRKGEQAKRSRMPFSEDQVLRWFTQAMLGLKHIHDRHILHRDLKPGNFFLSKSGTMKMGDFGIAKVLSNTMACARTQIGTPYYMSPEVCHENPYTWPSDIWAMGCILYELCALKVPFDAQNISGLVQKICRGPIPSVPPGYSDFVRKLCVDMLNRDAKARPTPDDILKLPKIQTMVKQMLEEARACDAAAEQQPNGGADAKPKGSPALAAAALAPPARGPTGGAAGFRKGDLVEYFSGTHKNWLPATVINSDNGGQIVIDLKPNTWITRDDQT